MTRDIPALLARLSKTCPASSMIFNATLINPDGPDAIAAIEELLARIEELEAEQQDEIVDAYCAGALAVHENWQEGCDPCFKEAAYDYFAALTPSNKDQDARP